MPCVLYFRRHNHQGLWHERLHNRSIHPTCFTGVAFKIWLCSDRTHAVIDVPWPMRRQPSSFRHSPQKQLGVVMDQKNIQKNIHRACRWIINFDFDHFYRCLHFSIGFEKYISKSHQVAYRLQVQEAIHQLHVDALQVAIVLRNLRVAEWPPKLLEFRNGIRLFFENIHWLCQSAFENFKKFRTKT